MPTEGKITTELQQMLVCRAENTANTILKIIDLSDYYPWEGGGIQGIMMSALEAFLPHDV